MKSITGFRISVYSLMCIICAVHIMAVGIQGGGVVTLQFQPGLEKTYTYGLVNDDKIQSFLEGELAEYATLIDPAQNTGPREITVKLKLPQALEPGTHTLYIGGREVYETAEGTVGGLASIRTRIVVISLWDGKYPVYSFSVKDMNINETVNLTLSIVNYGKERIESTTGYIEIFDDMNNSITTLTTDSKPIDSFTSVSIHAPFNSVRYDLQPGYYWAQSKMVYDGITHDQVIRQKFLLGSMKLRITSTTPEVFFNATNKYEIRLESDWQGDIKNVYAKILTPNNKTLKTPSIDLNKPWLNPGTPPEKATGTLEAYWETPGIVPGDYQMDIEVFYGKLSEKKIVPVKVILGEAPKVEKPAGFQLLSFDGSKVTVLNIQMQISIFLMVILCIIVVLNLYFLILRKKDNAPKDPKV